MFFLSGYIVWNIEFMKAHTNDVLQITSFEKQPVYMRFRVTPKGPELVRWLLALWSLLDENRGALGALPAPAGLKAKAWFWTTLPNQRSLVSKNSRKYPGTKARSGIWGTRTKDLRPSLLVVTMQAASDTLTQEIGNCFGVGRDR